MKHLFHKKGGLCPARLFLCISLVSTISTFQLFYTPRQPSVQLQLSRFNSQLLGSAAKDTALNILFNKTPAPEIPDACTPPLVNERYFSGEFADRLAQLEPITYAQALDGYSGIRTWLTISMPPSRAAKGSHSDRDLVRRARMASRTLGVYCKHRDLFRTDLAPENGCPEEKGSLYSHSTPTYSWPWCFPPNDTIHIMSVDCGIVDNYMSHPNVAFTLYTEKGVISTDRGRWAARSDVPVIELEQIAIMGAAEYPTAPGKLQGRISR